MSEENNEKRKQEGGASDTSGAGDAAEKSPKPVDPEREAKIKAAAEARAARAAAKAKEAEGGGETSGDSELPKAADAEREAKIKAAAEARAARAAAKAKQVEGEAPADGAASAGDADKEAKAKAAAEARAARAAARAQRSGGDAAADDAPKEPSPNQPRLDAIVKLIQEQVGTEAIEEAVINERDRHIPTITIKNDRWPDVARLIRTNEELGLSYLSNLSGVDYETHLETVYYFMSFQTKHSYCFKVKTSRDEPSIHSVTPVWATANWQEREVFDLLGIDFPGHPDLRRIMMPDDWVGHPLRKDYVPIDPEV